jgi:cytochrome c oxidase subunit 4
MSQQTAEHHDHPVQHPAGAEHDHPGDGLYIRVALILGLITAAEVATYYVDIGKAMVPALCIMMVAKFAIVGAYFMHLKFDSSLFTRVFASGIVLAIGVYLAALTSLEIFSN